MNQDRDRRAGSRHRRCRSVPKTGSCWPAPAWSTRLPRPTGRGTGRSARPGRSARRGSAASRSTSGRRPISPGCCSWPATPSAARPGGQEAVPVAEARRPRRAASRRRYGGSQSGDPSGPAPRIRRQSRRSSPVLRGRLRESEQLHRTHGLPLPLEIRHDEFTIDIAENQILRTACERMLGVPGVSAESQRMLRRLLRDFADVTSLARRDPIPELAANPAELPLPLGAAPCRAGPARDVRSIMGRATWPSTGSCWTCPSSSKTSSRWPSRTALDRALRRPGGRPGSRSFRRGNAGAAAARHRLEDPRHSARRGRRQVQGREALPATRTPTCTSCSPTAPFSACDTATLSTPMATASRSVIQSAAPASRSTVTLSTWQPTQLTCSARFRRSAM